MGMVNGKSRSRAAAWPMQRLVSILALLLLAWGAYQLQACVGGVLPGSPQQAGTAASGGMLTPSQATELLQRHPDGSLAILDVRTPAEFEAGHARNAVNIPVQELARHVDEVPNGPLLIICRSGVRAQKAYGMLVSSGRPAQGLWYLKGFTQYDDGIPSFHAGAQ